MKGNFINTLYLAALFVVGGIPHLFAEHNVYGPSLDPASQLPPRQTLTEKHTVSQSQATWRVIDTPTRPAPRDFPFLAFDPNRERLLMFGGVATGTGHPEHYTGVFFDDLWEFDGVDWTRLPSNTPSPRCSIDEPGAYDPVRDRWVIAGGWTEGDWRGRAGTWEMATSETGMSSFELIEQTFLKRYTMFDTHRNGVISIDGDGRVEFYSPPSWTNLSTAGAWGFGRGDFESSFDVSRGEAVVFGGFNFSVPGAPQGAPAQNDLWAWNSATNTWRELTPPSSPPPRARHQAVYHVQRGTHIIFGGTGPAWGSESIMSDIWEYDPTANTWTEILVTNPTFRGRHAMAYDSINHRVYSFGGRDGNWGHTDELLVLENLPVKPTGDSWQVH